MIHPDHQPKGSDDWDRDKRLVPSADFIGFKTMDGQKHIFYRGWKMGYKIGYDWGPNSYESSRQALALEILHECWGTGNYTSDIFHTFADSFFKDQTEDWFAISRTAVHRFFKNVRRAEELVKKL